MLLLAVIDDVAPLGLVAVVVGPEHGGGVWVVAVVVVCGGGSEMALVKLGLLRSRRCRGAGTRSDASLWGAY